MQEQQRKREEEINELKQNLTEIVTQREQLEAESKKMVTSQKQVTIVAE